MASQPPTAPTKVFLDSSVLIAAAISARGSARDLLIAGFQGRVQLALGQLSLDETERNLTRTSPAALPVFILMTQALPVELITKNLPGSPRLEPEEEWEGRPLATALLASGM